MIDTTSKSRSEILNSVQFVLLNFMCGRGAFFHWCTADLVVLWQLSAKKALYLFCVDLNPLQLENIWMLEFLSFFHYNNVHTCAFIVHADTKKWRFLPSQSPDWFMLENLQYSWIKTILERRVGQNVLLYN